MSCPIHIGIAGWSYPDWKGIVYTSAQKDQLAYVSRFVDCIEINSSFYRVPVAKTSRSWLQRTRERQGFFFTTKLHRSFTHEGQWDHAVVRAFHEGLAPLLEAGRLKHLLAQFRYDFVDGGQARDQLCRIVEHFAAAFHLVVEVRHKSWEAPEALAFLEGLGVSVCNLDYPMARDSFSLDQCTIGREGYVRLHGRNYGAWFSKAGRDETYDYCYSGEELLEIKQRLTRLADSFWHMVVIGNNHYKGAELANAIELKSLLTGKKQRVPETLRKAYPRLERIALADTEPGYLPF